MSKNRTLLGRGITGSLMVGVVVASAAAIAEESWVAPAPMGPYGGHFDFGVPATTVGAAPEDQLTPQVEYAIYQRQSELPVINASYPTQPETKGAMASTSTAYAQSELEQIDPAWSLEPQDVSADPQGMNGLSGGVEDVWALGEIRQQQLPQLLGGEEAAAEVERATAALDSSPCTVQPGMQQHTTDENPYQEAILDEFESAELDMERVAHEADRLSRVEEDRSQQWDRSAPQVFYPTFMPDSALGVRRANAMDPLALIPQMRGPVQYFGFTQ